MECNSYCQYYLLWRSAFDLLYDKNIINELKRILSQICENYKYNVEALHIENDRIYISVLCLSTVAPYDVMRTLRSVSAIELIKIFPWIKEFYVKNGCIWENKCTLSTVPLK